MDGQERSFDLADRAIARQRWPDATGEVFEHDRFGRMKAWYEGVPDALDHVPGSEPR